MLGEEAEKADRVKQVGFAGSVWPGDARKGPKPDVYIQQILKALHMQPCQHALSSKHDIPLDTGYHNRHAADISR